MKNQAGRGKSKLYCNRCGSFDLTKLDRTFTAKYIFNEPRKLHCQSCDAKLSFQQIAINRPLTLPSFYAESDEAVLSNDKLGRPIYVTIDDYVASASSGPASPNKKHWFPFWTGVVGGLALFSIIISLFIMSPYSKARSVTITKAVYEQPIMRLGDVELLRLDNTKSKNANIEVTLLDEPKKAPDELVWDYVAGSVERMSRQPRAVARRPRSEIRTPVRTIQQDLDRLLP